MSKAKVMKNVIKSIQLFLLFLLITKSSNGQDYDAYRTSDAVLLQVNDDVQKEGRLNKVVIALSNNSTQLSVRTTIPFALIDDLPSENAISGSPGLLFSLKMTINPWQVQDYLTSSKVFNTQGALTLNNTTRQVRVDYIPFPSDTDLDGDFNLTMIIQFKPADFGLDEFHANSKFIIKIGDARVNRI